MFIVCVCVCNIHIYTNIHIKTLQEHLCFMRLLSTVKALAWHISICHIQHAFCTHIIWYNFMAQPGPRVFEAGCAAGAFLDSVARQFGVQVALS